MRLSVPRAGGHRGNTHSGPFARIVENSYRYLYLTLLGQAGSVDQKSAVGVSMEDNATYREFAQKQAYHA
jgi:hypothetical protein